MSEEKEEDVKLPTWFLKLNAFAGSFFLTTLLAILGLNFGIKRLGLLPEATITVINQPLILTCLGALFLTGYRALKILNTVLDFVSSFMKKMLSNGK